MVSLLHDATAVISYVCEEGGVFFRVFFDSDIVVPIFYVNLAPINASSD